MITYRKILAEVKFTYNNKEGTIYYTILDDYSFSDYENDFEIVGNFTKEELNDIENIIDNIDIDIDTTNTINLNEELKEIEV